MEQVSPYLTPAIQETPEAKAAAIEKFFNVHLNNVNNARRSGDSDAAETSFNLMILHLNRHQLTEEEIKTTVKELALEQAIWQKKICDRLAGRAGLTKEIERLNKYLDFGQLTSADLGDELTEAA